MLTAANLGQTGLEWVSYVDVFVDVGKRTPEVCKEVAGERVVSWLPPAAEWEEVLSRTESVTGKDRADTGPVSRTGVCGGL